MMRTLSRIAGLALLTGLLWTPSASASPQVYVRIGPPPVVVERVPPPPYPGYVWVGGHHYWNGARYVWVRGGWVRPPYRYSRWESGRWRHSHHGYYWAPGRWHRDRY